MKLNILDRENEYYKGWSRNIGVLYDESYKDKYFLIKEEDLNDDDCFLIPISVAGLTGYLSIYGENDGKTFLDIFSDRIKKLVKENNGFILVSWFAEGHITQQNYKDLHNELKKHNMPANKIMFLASDMNGNIQYDKFCDRNNIKDKIHIFEASHRFEATCPVSLGIIDAFGSTFSSIASSLTCGIGSGARVSLARLIVFGFAAFSLIGPVSSVTRVDESLLT